MLKTYAVALTVTDAGSVAIGRRVLAAGRAAVVVRVGGFVGVVPAPEDELGGVDYRIENSVFVAGCVFQRWTHQAWSIRRSPRGWRQNISVDMVVLLTSIIRAVDGTCMHV